MNAVLQMKKDKIKQEMTDGILKGELLYETYPGIRAYKCDMKAGQTWKPKVYSINDKAQIFFFTNGAGYITTTRTSFNITEKTVFIPDFDKDEIAIHAVTDLEFLQFDLVLSDYDKERLEYMRISLPRFKLLSDCWCYEEAFKDPNGKSYMIIENRFFGRFSMGATMGHGPTYVGQHTHPDLAQWYYAFPGSKFKYTVAGETIDMNEGDWAHIAHNVSHGSVCEEGDIIDYLWFELKIGKY